MLAPIGVKAPSRARDMAEQAKQTRHPPRSGSPSGALAAWLLLKARPDRRTGPFATSVRHSTTKNGSGQAPARAGGHPSASILRGRDHGAGGLADRAVKLGWQRPMAPVLGRRPNVFDACHIPAPRKWCGESSPSAHGAARRPSPLPIGHVARGRRGVQRPTTRSHAGRHRMTVGIDSTQRSRKCSRKATRAARRSCAVARAPRPRCTPGWSGSGMAKRT